jgi:hypothetical protein
MKKIADMYEISLDYFVGILIVFLIAVLCAITNRMAFAAFDMCIIILLAIIGNSIWKKQGAK